MEHAGRDEVGDERLLAERQRPTLVTVRPQADPRPPDRGRAARPRAGPGPRARSRPRSTRTPCSGTGCRPARARSPRGWARDSGAAAPRPSSRCPASRSRTVTPRSPRTRPPRSRTSGGKPLERLHDPAVGTLGRLGARDDGVTVHDHGAGAAGALRRAAVLHRAQATAVPQDVEQRCPGRRLDLDRPAVEREVHRTPRGRSPLDRLALSGSSSMSNRRDGSGDLARAKCPDSACGQARARRASAPPVGCRSGVVHAGGGDAPSGTRAGDRRPGRARPRRRSLPLAGRRAAHVRPARRSGPDPRGRGRAAGRRRPRRARPAQPVPGPLVQRRHAGPRGRTSRTTWCCPAS